MVFAADVSPVGPWFGLGETGEGNPSLTQRTRQITSELIKDKSFVFSNKTFQFEIVSESSYTHSSVENSFPLDGNCPPSTLLIA
jgi:hypothetical protein